MIDDYRRMRRHSVFSIVNHSRWRHRRWNKLRLFTIFFRGLGGRRRDKRRYVIYLQSLPQLLIELGVIGLSLEESRVFDHVKLC